MKIFCVFKDSVVCKEFGTNGMCHMLRLKFSFYVPDKQHLVDQAISLELFLQIMYFLAN